MLSDWALVGDAESGHIVSEAAVNGVATPEEPAEIAKATEVVIQRSGGFSRAE